MCIFFREYRVLFFSLYAAQPGLTPGPVVAGGWDESSGPLRAAQLRLRISASWPRAVIDTLDGSPPSGGRVDRVGTGVSVGWLSAGVSAGRGRRSGLEAHPGAGALSRREPVWAWRVGEGFRKEMEKAARPGGETRVTVPGGGEDGAR